VTNKKITVALVGQPNVGKSMLINSISNANLKVGNFSGVTVQKEEVSLSYDGYDITIVDLPGTYAINGYTIDEKITNDFLNNSNYDLIVNVVDSTALKRNLLLTTQLLEDNPKMIIALNFSDEAKKENIQIDDSSMSKLLGSVCVRVSAKKHKGIEKLLNMIISTYKFPKESSRLCFSEPLEEEIRNIVIHLEEKGFECNNKRALAIKILQEDQTEYARIHEHPIWIGLSDVVRDSMTHLYLHHDTKNTKSIFESERSSFVQGVIKKTVVQQESLKIEMTERIDKLLINKFLGLPIFLFFMWVLFQATFTLGALPMEHISSMFEYMSSTTKMIIGDGFLGLLIADGIISGVGAVITFLPNIVILFFGIALLENTGYMARVSFMLDGFFYKFGLHGKSFIPLVTGFGCSVPAYMSTRTLKNESDRLITLFVIGFMSCGAKLPIYVLLVSAFLTPDIAGNALFVIYLSGAILGLLVAKVLRIVVFRGEEEPFVMEMPKYRMPSIKLIWHTVWGKAYMYLKKAGTFILVASILIWIGSNYPKDEQLQQLYQSKITNIKDNQEINILQNELKQINLENSYFGMIGKATQPFFAPMGFDWKMTVALEAGLAAKEVVVATLGILYGYGESVDDKHSGILSSLRQNIPLNSAMAFLVFSMIYLPCLAATAVFTKEAGAIKYTIYLFVFTTALAWVLSYVAYLSVSALLA
jgi:ferrous iron transport protein B